MVLDLKMRFQFVLQSVLEKRLLQLEMRSDFQVPSQLQKAAFEKHCSPAADLMVLKANVFWRTGFWISPGSLRLNWPFRNLTLKVGTAVEAVVWWCILFVVSLFYLRSCCSLLLLYNAVGQQDFCGLFPEMGQKNNLPFFFPSISTSRFLWPCWRLNQRSWAGGVLRWWGTEWAGLAVSGGVPLNSARGDPRSLFLTLERGWDEGLEAQ